MKFTCGCCGTWFTSTNEEQRKFDQDKGYGKCESCAKEAEERNEKDWQELETLFRTNLNPANLAVFEAMDHGEKRGIMAQAIEDGVVQYTIKGANHGNGRHHPQSGV